MLATIFRRTAVRPRVATRLFSSETTLWDKLGGEGVLKPMCNDLYDLHASDPLTAPWFGEDKSWNQRTSDAVKEHVFHFFSAATGGPFEYKGRDMIEAHKSFAELKPITDNALHALIYHVPKMMAKHGAGDAEDRDGMLEALYGLRSDVRHFGKKEFEASSESLYDRMGGEPIIRPMCSDLYDLHASDPLTAEWFGADKPWNTRTADEVKENVFTFFSAGIGGPHEYKGRNMIEAHANMRLDKMFTKVSIHAIMYHVISVMEKHNAGSERERDEVLGILESLRSQVFEGKE